MLPKWGGYEVVEEIETLSDGAKNVRLARQYKDAEDERQTLL